MALTPPAPSSASGGGREGRSEKVQKYERAYRLGQRVSCLLLPMALAYDWLLTVKYLWRSFVAGFFNEPQG